MLRTSHSLLSVGSENKVAEHLLQLHSLEMFALYSVSAHSLVPCAQMLQPSEDSAWSSVGEEKGSPQWRTRRLL